MIKRTESAKSGLPSPFRDRLIIRCTDATFGLAKSSGKPMITAEWEICGAPNNTGGVDTEVESGGKKYKIAGSKLQRTYFSLSDKAIEKYFEFWDKAEPGITHTEVNPEQPDIQYLKDGVVLEAIVASRDDYQRKQISDEEKAKLVEEGKEPVGDFITDGDGNKIAIPVASVTMWLKKFTGTVEPY